SYGVTALADAGSAGEASFHGLREYIIDPAVETVRAFINIGSIGLVACNRVPELIDPRSIDIDRTLAVIEAHRDVICGVKIRASGVIVGSWGITPLRIAKRVAEIAGLPLMVHVGEPPPLIDEVLPLLAPGDIVTHCFNGKPAGSIGDTDAVWEMARKAAESGILMDIGHGVASFDFNIARAALQRGFLPFSISTDLHGRNLKGPVCSLALTVSKFHMLGMDPESCLAAITEHPRSILHLPARQCADPGERADFTLFRLVDTALDTVDSMGHDLTLSRLFQPLATVIGDSYAPARAMPDPAAHATV
ncbi:MAG: amidohydrolase/deacetylase family metallohydrolase, partial [Rhodobacteraceae bacterium]|nr:amidohydrolase/deacetylase family metallohydrolase [Paracoccaceae bacterium]